MRFFVLLLVLVALASGALSARPPRRRRRAAAAWAIPLLVAVVCAGAWLRYELAAAHHAMYLDEAWYEEAACNLARTGRLELCEATWSGTACRPYEKAIGWPVLLSLWKGWAGCGSSAGIAASRLLGTASIPLLAAAARRAGASPWQAVFAAALLVMHPTHVEWSATGETNVAAGFALLLGVCGALGCLRRRRRSDAALAAAALGLAVSVRPEFLLPAVVTAVALVAAGAPRGRRNAPAALLIAAVASLAALTGLPLWNMNEDISGGGFLALANIPSHVAGAGVPAPIRAPVALLGLAGLPMVARRRGRAAALLLFAAALGAALVVWAYDRFAERMLLGATLLLLPASGLALAWLDRRPGAAAWRRVVRRMGEAAIVAALALLWRSPLLSLATPAETQLLETRIAARVGRASFAAESLFVAEQPAILAAVGLRGVMSSAAALADEARLERAIAAGRPVYFLRDMYCEVGFAGGGGAARCAHLRERFAAATVVEETLNVRRYSLQRLSSAAAGGAAAGGPFPE